MRKWILIILGVVVLVPAVLVATLLYSPLGVSLIASQLDRLEQFGVRLEGVTGTLSGELRVARFELNNPSVHIVSHDIVLSLRIREALLQTVGVESLTARDTVVEILNAPPTPPSVKPLRFLPAFLRVDIAAAELDGLRYVNIDGTTVDATRLHGSLRVSPRALRIRSFQLEAPQFNASGNGRLRAQRPLGLELRADGAMRLERGTRVAASGQASGTIEKLNIHATLLQPDSANVDAVFSRDEGRWQLVGNLAAPVVSLEPWMDRPPLSFRNVALRIEAAPEGLRARGNLGVPEWSQHDLTVNLQGRYAQRVLHLGSSEVMVNDTPVHLTASGDLTFDGGAPSLDMQAHWTHLRWPLDGAAYFDSAEGNGTLRGPLPYDYAINAQVAVPAALIHSQADVTGNAQASGTLGSDELTLSQYTLTALNGTIDGNASLQFAQPRRWALTAQARRIDPSLLQPAFGGNLNFDLTASGAGFDRQGSFDATLANLRGTLRDQPVRAAGRIQRDRQGWRVRNVTAQMGDARAAVNGDAGAMLNIDATLHAASLATLVPQAHGSIDFTGSARGPAKSPRIRLTLQAADLLYQQWRVASAGADLDVDLGGNDPSRLAISAQSVGQAQPFIESVHIDGSGNAAAHRITVAVTGVGDAGTPAPHTTLLIDGAYAKETWSGTLRATEIGDGRSNDTFSMPAPASFVVARDRLELQKLCLALGHGQFCADASWRRNGPWEGTLSGYEIPLAAVLPASSADAEYGGRIEGRVHASGKPGTPWLLDAGARISDAAVIYRPPGADPETLNLGNGGLSATATAERVDFSLGVQAFEDTYLYANAHILRNGSNDLLHLPLSGDVRARAADANILPIIFTEIDNAAGLLTANLDVRGTLAAPELTGRIELSNGAFDSYRVNLALRQLNLVADLVNTGVNFQGSGTAGDGRMTVGGQFAWENRALHGDLQLKGENLLVADLPEYHVIASPDLHFRIDDREVNVAGDVNIPSARIQPVNLSGAVQASEDARYVGETEAERSGRMTLHSEVRIQIGDDVRIDAFGLQGRIVGGVGTTVVTGQTPVGRGELSVKEGRYEAYGQKLDITRGRLLFDASPLEDPGLDIEAQRKIETITVGMNVRGTLKAPRLSFFSDPSMPQTEIMSYLLVGKGIDSMQSGDAATVGSASDTLTLQGGGYLASQLGHRLGIEQVGVESSRTSEGQTNTSLVLGKFLSPRLFISYGISLTESINTFKLRYTISDRWTLKVEAGEVQSGDLEYTIER